MTNNIQKRQMPVFISSTFQDMQDEREYLIKKVFPKLREIAAQRLVSLFPIDLRWGITQEDSKSGKVVELCLYEIERCQPFFIGILGNRYGWCPTEADLKDNAMLFDKYQWLSKDISEGLSVTEIEMQFAVLRRQSRPNAFFFIRKDSQSPASMDERQQRLIHKIKDECRDLSLCVDNEAATAEGSNCLYAYYETPEELAGMLERVLIRQLETLFPVSESDNRWYCEKMAQQAYFQELCDTYIPTANNSLITYNLNQPLDRYQMITSLTECFYGKSAFIANWIREKQEEGKHDVIYHFVGVGYLGGNYKNILKRLCVEVSSLYGLVFEEEDDDYGYDYKSTLSRLLAQIKADKRLYLVIDGLQHLPEYDDSKTLDWLPSVPDNVTLLVTTPYYDRTNDIFYRRYGSRSYLDSFEADELERFMEEYLKKYGKKLSSKQSALILTAFSAAEFTPFGVKDILTLKSLLSELVIFGSYERLDDCIAYYCADNMAHFYNRMFERLENDFGYETVRDILELIICSRTGLSEVEILEISNATMLQWSSLRCSISHLLTSRGGKYYIDKPTIISYIQERYSSAEARIRSSLCHYFYDSDDHKDIDEYLFQCYMMGNNDALYKTLVSIDVAPYLYESNLSEFLAYWKRLYESDSSRYTIGNYATIYQSQTIENARVLAELGEFAAKVLTDEQSAMLLSAKAKDIYEAIFHRDYDILAMLYLKLGMYEKALENIAKNLPAARSLSWCNISGYLSLLEAKAFSLKRLGKIDQATILWEMMLHYVETDKDEGQTVAIQARLQLCAAYLLKGNEELFKEHIEQAISYIVPLFGEKHPYLGEAYYIYGTYHEYVKHRMEAIYFYQKAIDILTKYYPETHDKIRRSRKSINKLKAREDSEVDSFIYNKLSDSLKWLFPEAVSQDNSLDNNEFLDFLDFYEGAADDLHLVDEHMSDGLKEYVYKFKYHHECTINSGLYIINNNSHCVYVSKDAAGRYRKGDKIFKRLKDAQVYSMICVTHYKQTYCDYKSDVIEYVREDESPVIEQHREQARPPQHYQLSVGEWSDQKVVDVVSNSLRAENVDAVFSLMKDPRVFTALYQNDAALLHKAWVFLREKGINVNVYSFFTEELADCSFYMQVASFIKERILDYGLAVDFADFAVDEAESLEQKLIAADLKAECLMLDWQLYRSLKLLKNVEEARKKNYGENSLEVAKNLFFIGRLASYNMSPQYAIPTLEHSIRIMRANSSTPQQDIAEVLLWLGSSLMDCGRFAAAAAALTEAEELFLAVYGDCNTYYLSTLVEKSRLECLRGNYAEAMELVGSAISKSEDYETNLLLLRAQLVKVGIYGKQGDLTAVRKELSVLLPRINSACGLKIEMDPNLCLFAERILSSIDLDSVLMKFPQFTNVWQQGEMFPIDILSLGKHIIGQKRYQEAKEKLERGIELSIQYEGEFAPVTTELKYVLGLAQIESGEAEKGLENIRLAQSARENVYGADHPVSLSYHLELCRREDMGLEEKHAQMKQCVEVLTRRYGENSLLLVPYKLFQVELFIQEQRLDTACAVLTSLLELEADYLWKDEEGRAETDETVQDILRDIYMFYSFLSTSPIDFLSDFTNVHCIRQRGLLARHLCFLRFAQCLIEHQSLAEAIEVLKEGHSMFAQMMEDQKEGIFNECQKLLYDES